MIWIAFTLVSVGLVKDVDHRRFNSYTECEKYVERQHSGKVKSCFTSFAKFKQPKKKVKHEHS